MDNHIVIEVTQEICEATNTDINFWRKLDVPRSRISGRPMIPVLIKHSIADIPVNEILHIIMVDALFKIVVDTRRMDSINSTSISMNVTILHDMIAVSDNEWNYVMYKLGNSYSSYCNNATYHVKQSKGLNLLNNHRQQREDMNRAQSQQMQGGISNSYGVGGLRGARTANANMQMATAMCGTPWDDIKSDNEFNWNLPLTKDECYKPRKHKSGRVIPTLSSKIEVSININNLNKRRKNG